VIPLLLVVGLLGGEAETLKWADAAKALGMIALLIVAGRLLVRPVLRYVAETRLREVFVGFTLLLVLGTAALMAWVGLSMALGAFLAGVMLADSEYRHELELDIEPFKGLLLGLFFIAVGMSVDVGLFLRAPHLVLGLALGVVLLKAVILFPIAQAFGYCGRTDAGLFAVALSQAGEFAFVLFGAASTILPSPVAAILNAAVAVSMLTTPFVVMGYERFLIRRLDRPVERAPDPIRETNPVIVAGFGASARWWFACCAALASALRSSTTIPARSTPCAASAGKRTTAMRRGSTCSNPPARPALGCCWSPSTIPRPRCRS